MIYDRLERLTQYKGLNSNLDKMIEYVEAHNIQDMKQGRYEIDGENCWINSNVVLLVDENTLYERHTAYIDLQIPLDEGENIMIKPVEDLDWEPFDDETGFTRGGDGLKLDMTPGTFAVFFPGDAHNCGISKNGQVGISVRKLVGKAHV